MNKFCDNPQKTKLIAPLIKNLLTLVGENCDREGLQETPQRVAKVYQEILDGYNYDPKDVFKIFDSGNFEGMVVVGKLKFYSLCEHHMLPFCGEIYIGYVPNGKILGLSKFGRLVEIFARRLQVQEKLTQQIIDSIMKYLDPKGVIVVSQAEHLCMGMRGVRKEGSLTTVVSKSGIFKDQRELVDDFFLQIGLKK